MEVLAAATTVCALFKAIYLWIDEQTQEELLLTQIAPWVRQIRDILKTFYFRGVQRSRRSTTLQLNSEHWGCRSTN